MMLARDHQITTTHQRHFRRVCLHKAPTILQADDGHALAGWQYRGMAIFINILLVLLALALIGLAIWGIVRYRYVKSLKALGWEFDSNPPIDVANGLNVPPFGIGFGRSVDDAIYGASRDQATSFVAFKYRCTNWRSAGYVVRMPLPAPYLPGEVTGPACSRPSPVRRRDGHRPRPSGGAGLRGRAGSAAAGTLASQHRPPGPGAHRRPEEG